MGNSFKFDTTHKRSELMKKIRSTNTKPEIVFRKELWNSGIRYRLNSALLPGKPDIVINKYKIVIFIDGNFWHGYQWKKKKTRIKANREYWIKKIEGNIKRDKINNKKLKKLGFTIFRFWDHQINDDLFACLSQIHSKIQSI